MTTNNTSIESRDSTSATRRNNGSFPVPERNIGKKVKSQKSKVKYLNPPMVSRFHHLDLKDKKIKTLKWVL